jgi:dinuclear metal center YbgI/SA1388 family protein
MTKNTKPITEVLRSLNHRAPLGSAEDWDNVGLLIGDSSKETMGAVVSIDLTFEAVELAVLHGYSLIVNHHPCIFPKNRGLSRVIAGTPVYEAIQKGIAVAAYHTNFDQCALEVVEAVSQGLGVQPKGRLLEHSTDALLKLVTFVPSTHVEQVRNAICEAGAGCIGNYDISTFSLQGEGTFRGGDATRPFIGTSGILEKVQEIRLETVLPRGLRTEVLRALQFAHPYEEVAYDFYPLEQQPSQGGLIRGLGYGFWGEFPSPRPFSDVVKDVKDIFNINGFWITNPTPSQISSVGFVAGKGASFVDAAFAKKCDLFITGEAGYHTALGGLRRGMAVMELGHCESEKFFVVTMKNWLSKLGLGVVETQIPTQRICSGGTP